MNQAEVAAIAERYKKANRRLLLLDYDGTLVPTVSRPEDAVPSDTLRTIMRQLSEDSRNTIVIVSGRKHEELEKWLGWLPVEFVAEHSVLRRERTGEWTTLVAPDKAQIVAAKSLLTEFAEPYEGTVLEEKTGGVALHYRHAPMLDEAKVDKWVEDMNKSIYDNNLKSIHGKKIIELVPNGVDKGVAARYWLTQQPWDFVLAAGDDTTDEAMFRALGAHDVSLHIGTAESTAAKYILPSQPDFIALLKQFIN